VNGDWTARTCGPDGCGGHCGVGCPEGYVCDHDEGTCRLLGMGVACTWRTCTKPQVHVNDGWIVCDPADPQPGNCSFAVRSPAGTAPLAHAIDPAIWYREQGHTVLVLGTMKVM
jgi:hypothetical protein